MMRLRKVPIFLVASAAVSAASAFAAADKPATAELPYVYTNWRHFTVADGLPNDHIFSVKADGLRVWIGTEDGLACLDKRTGKIRSWREKDGLPFQAVTAIDVDQKTGDVWLGMFGGGLARFSGGRFDHFHQLNSGLVNDVVYGVAIEHDHVWAATTAGASRYNTRTGQWTVFTEKNAPMEEIWNYSVSYDRGKVYLGIWGSGCLEFDVAAEKWKDYLDPDREMEIDLYRDDGIVHVIVTGASHAGDALWISTYFGNCRYDGRHWRGLYAHETGMPSDFTNAVKARSSQEAWFATDKGLGVVADFATDTVVRYTRDPKTLRGRAVVFRAGKELAAYDLARSVPHNFAIALDIDGYDAWVGTAKGLGWAIGEGYHPQLRRSALPATARAAMAPAPVETSPANRSVLEEINSLNAYQAPNLPLKSEEKYAHIPAEYKPFRHVKPFKEHFLQQMEYTGPGRAIPEPDHVATVRIGFLGPLHPTVSVATGGKSHEEVLGNKMWQGALLAVEEANARGGYHQRKIPFELMQHNDNGLWGSSANEIITMTYKEKVWAILGSIDGANSHIAIRVALKGEILVMNTGDTDPTYIETNIPWTCRVIGDDRQMGYMLVDYMYKKLGLGRVGIIRASNRYGRFGVREVVDSSRRLQRPVRMEMAYPVGSEDFGLQLERLQAAGVDAVVHWGDAADGARILNQMRARGMKQPYFACDRCLSEEFVKIAGANAEGVVCTLPWDPSREDPLYLEFRERFRKRFAEEPETYAAHAYDGMNMLLWAIQMAGLNRAKIRDLIAYRRDPWKGVTGDIILSSAMDDIGEVYLAKRQAGAWKHYSRRDLGIPRAEPGDQSAPSLQQRAAPLAFRNFRLHPTEYAGPGRSDPEPTELGEVRIGYFGPDDPAHPEGGDMWRAAQLAVDEANRQGGFHGRPFRLVPVWSENPWSAGVGQLARVVYRDKVWAVLGGIDGPSTHLAEQVVVKARLALLGPVSTDKTVNLVNVPWVFSCAPGDHLQAPLLAAGIAARVGARPLVLVSAHDHDCKLFAGELCKSLPDHHVRLLQRFEFDPASPRLDELVGQLSEQVGRVVGANRHAQGAPLPFAASPPRDSPLPLAGEGQGVRAALVILAGAQPSARLVKALRTAGFSATIFGGPWMGRRAFLAKAGAAAEGVVFPMALDPARLPPDFVKAFHARSGLEPDYAAAQTYDATRLLLAAVAKAGLNRARIRDAVEGLSPWSGVGGTICWDPAESNSRPPCLGTVRQGRVERIEITRTTAH